MKSFPQSLIPEIVRVLETKPVTYHHGEPIVQAGATVESIGFRDQGTKETIDVKLRLPAGRVIDLSLHATGFPTEIELPGNPKVSQLAYAISILVEEQIFGVDEEALPARLDLG